MIQEIKKELLADHQKARSRDFSNRSVGGGKFSNRWRVSIEDEDVKKLEELGLLGNYNFSMSTICRVALKRMLKECDVS